MKMFLRLIVAWGTLFCLNSSYSSIPNNAHPTTFLGPTLRGGFTSTFNNYSAYSLAGEAGVKNFRVGGTLGWLLAENQRLKVSGEYLWQKITYPFFSGNTNQWVQQAAIGARYQYLFYDCFLNPSFDISGYLSHAPSKNLHTVTGLFTNHAGVIQSFADHRRIAGSNAGGVSPGVTIHPWCGSTAGIDLNYDSVRYHKNFSPNKNASGFGGTLRLGQALSQNISVSALGSVRKPFNYYEADLYWDNVQYYGLWSVGVDAGYTAGKQTLPNTWNVGLSANYYLDRRCDTCVSERRTMNLKGDYKGEVIKSVPVVDDLLPWTADPAVHMPQVLAIPDENVVIPDPENPNSCPQPVPTLIGTIPNLTTTAFTTTTFDTASAFSPNSGLTYSINASPAPAGGNSVTINSSTGVVTVVNGGTPQVITATVTATNACGAATTSNTITLTYLETRG